MADIHIGDAVPLEATFYDDEGDLANPTTVTCKVKAPTGVETTPTATNESTGVYTASVTPDGPGTWHVRFEGTGVVEKSYEVTFFVQPSAFLSPS